MHEIELRFHVPAAQRERLRRFIDNPAPAPRQRLAAVYFDSADRQLARAGVGLRLRLEGERWVQTVKGPSDDGIRRLEHNALLPAGSAPVLDLARHAEHPLGERLQRQRGALRPVFRTDILRATRRLRVPGAEIELAWDEGQLLAGRRRLAVHELELELLSGSANALLAHAHQLVGALPLSLDLRSKAERGERLAAGQTVAPPCPAATWRARPGLSPAAALRARLQHALRPVAVNASQIGSGSCLPGHGPALRDSLRRLQRAVQAACAPQPPHPAWPALAAQAADWLRALDTVPEADPRALVAAVRQPAAQRLLIECLGWVQHLGGVAAADR